MSIEDRSAGKIHRFVGADHRSPPHWNARPKVDHVWIVWAGDIRLHWIGEEDGRELIQFAVYLKGDDGLAVWDLKSDRLAGDLWRDAVRGWSEP